MLENGIREISGEVRNSLDFHRSQDGGGEVSHVVLSGAAQDIPGFAEALQAARRRGPCRRPSRRRRKARRTGLHAPPGGRRRPGRHGGAPDESRQPDPGDQRGGVGPGAGRSGGAAYAVLALLGRARAARASLRHAPVTDLEPRAKAASLIAADAARAGRRRRSWPPTRAFSRCANSACRPSPSSSTSRFDWAHAFHELGRVLPRDASITSLDGDGRLGVGN